MAVGGDDGKTLGANQGIKVKILVPDTGWAAAAVTPCPASGRRWTCAVENINWRILLSNSSSPFSSNIGEHSIDNLVILSDFFNIYTNMNITLETLEDDILFPDTSYYLTLNGFNFQDINPPQFTIYINNQSYETIIATFDNTYFENSYIELNQVSNQNINNHHIFEFNLTNLEKINNYELSPFLNINVTHNNIKRTINQIPIFILIVSESEIDNQNTQIITECINPPSNNLNCYYDLRISHNGIENVIYNQTKYRYNLMKYLGSYLVWSTYNNQKSNVISFDATTTTLEPSTSTSFTIVYTIKPSSNNTCSEDDDDCNNALPYPLYLLVLGILTAIFTLFTCYYFCVKLLFTCRHNQSQRVGPRNDIKLESQRNSSYTQKTIQNDIDNNDNDRCLINNTYYSTENTNTNTNTNTNNETNTNKIDETAFMKMRLTRRINSNSDNMNINNTYPNISQFINSDSDECFDEEDISQYNVNQEQTHIHAHRQEQRHINLYADLQNEIINHEIFKNTNNRSHINQVYFSTEPNHSSNNANSEFSIYNDNYGFKRPIRRRHSSSSYGYASPNRDRDSIELDEYQHLERGDAMSFSPNINRYNNVYNKLNRKDF